MPLALSSYFFYFEARGRQTSLHAPPTSTAMFLLRSAIANAATRGGVSGSGRIASSSSTTSAAVAAASRSLSTVFLPSPFHRSAPRWRDDDDDDAAFVVEAGMPTTRAPPKASSYEGDAWWRLSGAIVARLTGDWTYAATTAISDASSSKRGVLAYRDGFVVDEREGVEAVSAAPETTTMIAETLPDPSPLSDLSVWLISTLKRRKKMMNKHKLRKRRKKLRLKTRK